MAKIGSMKVAIIADIHGNLRALEAVTADIEQWQPDVVVVNGDVVNRGPQNLACWQLIHQRQKEAGWVVLRGNHEDFVLASAYPHTAQAGPRYELRQFTQWSYNQLREVAFEMMALPDRWGVHPAGATPFLVMHGSLLGNRFGIYPDSTDEDLSHRVTPQTAVFVTAHTHRPLVRPWGQTQVVNVGAVGLPFDGNWLASYGRFTWSKPAGWQAEICRLSYDRLQAERDMLTTGFLEEAGPFAQMILVELRLSRGLIQTWANVYEEGVLKGEVNFAQSVRQFLDQAEYRDYLYPAGQEKR